MIDISEREMIDRMEKGEHLNLLDVREVMEFHTYNIGGTNIPLPGLTNKLDDLDWNKTDEIIVICKAGLRSAAAKSILELNGYQNVRNLTGGLLGLQRNQ